MKDPLEIAADAGAKLATFGARKQGAIVFAACIVIIPFTMLVGLDGKAGWLFMIGVAGLLSSLWIMATGRAGTRNEPKAPLWWWAGSIVVVAISLMTAFAALAIVGD
jgi:hypothetical protein